jgi:hypothetical protein
MEIIKEKKNVIRAKSVCKGSNTFQIFGIKRGSLLWLGYFDTSSSYVSCNYKINNINSRNLF